MDPCEPIKPDPDAELPLPRLVDRPIWPTQVVAQCPTCCKDLKCAPAPQPQIVNPKAPPQPPMFVLTCEQEDCNYTFVVPQQMPLVDFRREMPWAWAEVLRNDRNSRRCESCRIIIQDGEEFHEWPDKSRTCTNCGGPQNADLGDGPVVDPSEQNPKG